MHVRAGYTIALDTFGPTPMNLLLNVRPERQPDLLTPETTTFDPPVSASQHVDGFGNIATRILAPGGRITMAADFVIQDSGRPDDSAAGAVQILVQDLPADVLPFLLGSRYCDTDKLSQTAWSLFGGGPQGGEGVQTIVDYAHNRLRFDYLQADDTRSAHDGHTQQVGVCRDFAHLGITLCRCMNIPARYATGYLGDIGVPKDPAPMDFSAWFEVYLKGREGPRWYTFDARTILFAAVTPSAVSVSSAYLKLDDVRRLPEAPRTVAVLTRRAAFREDQRLILGRAARIMDATAGDDEFRRVAA